MSGTGQGKIHKIFYSGGFSCNLGAKMRAVTRQSFLFPVPVRDRSSASMQTSNTFCPVCMAVSENRLPSLRRLGQLNCGPCTTRKGKPYFPLTCPPICCTFFPFCRFAFFRITTSEQRKGHRTLKIWVRFAESVLCSSDVFREVKPGTSLRLFVSCGLQRKAPLIGPAKESHTGF
jgi:hypothetical protein